MNLFNDTLVTEIFETDPVRVFSALHHLPYSIFFDSADREHPAARYSFIACQPFETLESKNGVIKITGREAFEGDPFTVLQERLKYWSKGIKTLEGLPPFQGGAAGLFSYDLARGLEKLPATAIDNPSMPDMAVGIYDQVLAFDHAQRKTWLITHASGRNEARRKEEEFMSLMADGGREEKKFNALNLKWQSSFNTAGYQKNVRKVIEYIRAGDIFQANISQRFDAALPAGFCPFAHYKNLRAVNPAPFAAYMNIGDVKISSASPERFLTLHEGKVETRPIKGTRPRSADPALDCAFKTELENSEKDRAENTMIVDLLRNDLSRICTPESVEVTALCRLESFAAVHHLVSVIRGALQKDKDALDLLKACFPGGSVTGAPKIRAMEIIEEIEPTRRGPYCGSMGYIGFNGTMDSNILIRTLVYERNRVSFQTGGGIVADSESVQEYQESLDKADAIFRSFGQIPNKEKKIGTKMA